MSLYKDIKALKELLKPKKKLKFVISKDMVYDEEGTDIIWVVLTLS